MDIEEKLKQLKKWELNNLALKLKATGWSCLDKQSLIDYIVANFSKQEIEAILDRKPSGWTRRKVAQFIHQMIKRKKEKILKGLRKSELQALARSLNIKNFRKLTIHKLQTIITEEHSKIEIEEEVGTIRVKSQSGEKLLLDFFTEKKWITEAVIIATIPIAAYIVSFFFELGYTSFFYIPNSMISIELKLSFFPIFITASMLFLLYLYIFRLATEITLSEAIEGLILAIIWTILGIILIRIIFIIRLLNIVKSPLSIHNNSIILIISGIALIVFYCEYRVKFRIKKAPIYEWVDPILLALSGYFKFIKLWLIRNRGSIEQSLLVHSIALILSLFLFVHSIGLMVPSLKKDFLVFDYVFEYNNKEKKEKLVVLKKYSDIFICAPFDKKKKQIFQRFYFLKFADQKEISFEIKNIGPLVSQSEE